MTKKDDDSRPKPKLRAIPAQNSGHERRGRPFQPGESGNPGGRPKAVRELLAMARENVAASFELAVKLRDDEDQDARVRLEAAKFITSYGLGPPPKETPADEGRDAAVVETVRNLTREDLRTLIESTRTPEARRGDDDVG